MAELDDFKNNFMKLVEYDFKDEFSDEYQLPDERLFPELDDLEKWLTYKMSDNQGDCDSSELVKEIFKIVYPPKAGQTMFKGDTLNSFFNPLRSYLTIHVNDFRDVLFLSGERKLRAKNFFDKYKINDKKGAIDYSKTWSNLIIKNYSLFKIIEKRIKIYAKTTHTIGNFMPVPQYLNQGRVNKTSDYWDLALLGIYKYYNEDMSKDSLKYFLSEIKYSNETVIEQDQVVESCHKWLFGIGSWNSFVKMYFFQDFVSGNEEDFKEPIMYWENHSFEKIDPESEHDINQFLNKINDLIKKRGERICNELTRRFNIDSNASPTNATLSYYNQSAQAYAADTLSADMSKLYAFFLPHLPPRAAILDLGCGPGRDSLHFLKEGYRVRSVDGSPEFCKLASQLTGQPVLCRTFEDIDFTEEFDGIWACASILHVPSSRLPLVLENLSRALKKGGHLYASFKYGTFEGDRNGRYFTDMTEETLEKLIAPFEELTIIDTMVTGDVREGREEEKWLNVVVRKT